MNEAKERPEVSPPAEFLIVGLGASAGGLEALSSFFEKVPADSSMAFVVVTHQLPGRVSLMPELLARRCAVPMLPIDGPVQVEPNLVYLAPAGVKLSILGGKLFPEQVSDAEARHLPIDHFFRSLAQDQKERAVGIVLSGTGTDGTLGLKEIKGASGLTMAQEEASARYPGMPHSAISSLLIDHIVPPEEMPDRLLAYARGALRRVHGAPSQAEGDDAETLQRIFLLLRSRTGHDFSHYKMSTILRRIERRINVHSIEGLKEYLRYLQTNPNELDLLFKELLIGVTSFFRDPDAFTLLSETVIPALVEGKPEDYVLRAWVPGCSTGEEAYSLAILLREGMDRLKRRFAVQIFATDIDRDAVEVARAGLYPESIAADVDAPRLERFFSKEDSCFRIRKDIREMLVFAQQNLIGDPPFTKLDLLSCRNVLIYLDGMLQQRLIPIFHYALRPGGVLFLGSSETVGGYGHLFDPLDRKWKIFRRREVMSGSRIAEIPATLQMAGGPREAVQSAGVRKGQELGLSPLAERALLLHLVPPSVLMHERGEIVHIHGRTGAFLEPAPGPQGEANIYNMARPGLELELAVAVRHAATSGEVLHRGVRVKTNGDSVAVNLRVRRLTQPDPLRGLFLVSFEDCEPVPAHEEGAAIPGAPSEAVERISELERELQHAKEIHQSIIEELETANEELKSTNEELQSTNEELQSANEELETSKEEMQSLNEELQTVNTELQGKVEELSRANDDMKNLLNATDIATLFLDNDLNIKRYTEQARRVIRIIPSDIGRPIFDLVSTLRYSRFIEDAKDVLRTLSFKELEVQSQEGGWYLMRILPYRTTENVIDGLVVTFVDITKVKGLQEETRRIMSALRNSPSTVFGQDAALRYEWVYGPLFGREARVLGQTDEQILPPEDAAAVTAIKRQALAGGVAVRERLSLPVDGQRRAFDFFIEPLRGPDGALTGVSGVITDLAERGRSSHDPQGKDG